VDRDFFPDGTVQSLLVCNVGRPRPKAHERLPRLPFADVVTVR
jgi:hypothetical protein